MLCAYDMQNPQTTVTQPFAVSARHCCTQRRSKAICLYQRGAYPEGIERGGSGRAAPAAGPTTRRKFSAPFLRRKDHGVPYNISTGRPQRTHSLQLGKIQGRPRNLKSGRPKKKEEKNHIGCINGRIPRKYAAVPPAAASSKNRIVRMNRNRPARFQESMVARKATPSS